MTFVNWWPLVHGITCFDDIIYHCQIQLAIVQPISAMFGKFTQNTIVVDEFAKCEVLSATSRIAGEEH